MGLFKQPCDGATVIQVSGMMDMVAMKVVVKSLTEWLSLSENGR